mmetsp:Transcript_2573/g.10212  ORF Transcript_2573/g.10212 Transcript_2573/m.10212 type:complete len:347 (-) Transcript_2573:395-1435(-)
MAVLAVRLAESGESLLDLAKVGASVGVGGPALGHQEGVVLRAKVGDLGPEAVLRHVEGEVEVVLPANVRLFSREQLPHHDAERVDVDLVRVRLVQNDLGGGPCRGAARRERAARLGVPADHSGEPKVRQKRVAEAVDQHVGELQVALDDVGTRVKEAAGAGDVQAETDHHADAVRDVQAPVHLERRRDEAHQVPVGAEVRDDGELAARRLHDDGDHADDVGVVELRQNRALPAKSHVEARGVDDVVVRQLHGDVCAEVVRPVHRPEGALAALLQEVHLAPCGAGELVELALHLLVLGQRLALRLCLQLLHDGVAVVHVRQVVVRGLASAGERAPALGSGGGDRHGA